MKAVRKFQRLYAWLLIAGLVLLVFAKAVFAQNPTVEIDSLSGKYEGVARAEGLADLKFILELKNEAGKVSGRATSGETTVEISEGTFVDSKLTLKFAGHDGTFTAKLDGEKITGEWLTGSQKRTIEARKVETPSAAPSPATTVNLDGEWEAVADADGQPFPFLLVLHIEGEKLTGSSSSQLGNSTITNGTWKGGRFEFQLESPNGTVSLVGGVVDGKLAGEFDYAGQLQGKWVAVKKK